MATGEERVDDIAIRVLTELAEFRETAALQQAVWGFSELDCVPPRMFIVTKHVGGLALGAYDGGRMIGFSFGVVGCRRGGRPFLHSNMTGLLPQYQNRGLGRRMKLRQRDEALALGYRMIEWTFDPLEIRNAYFNIEKLGAVIRHYRPNCYGITSSKLHGSIPTDRLVAEWEIDTGRALHAIEHGRSLKSGVVRQIAVSAQAARVRSTAPDRTLEIQTAMREQFQAAFAEGLAVTGFRIDDDGGVYELSAEAWTE
jgi:predicted GNAT superfamily acetyltransferase